MLTVLTSLKGPEQKKSYRQKALVAKLAGEEYKNKIK
jgi:hypothetical protein